MQDHVYISELSWQSRRVFKIYHLYSRFSSQIPDKLHINRVRHLITDKGTQFTAHEFRKYCKRKKIKQRFGAIEKYGSIAVIERFIRSMKDECSRHIFILLKTDEMAFEHNIYAV